MLLHYICVIGMYGQMSGVRVSDVNLPANTPGRDAAARIAPGEPGDSVQAVGTEFALGAAPPAYRRSPSGILAGIVQLALVVALLTAAVLAYQAILASTPVAGRKSPERIARLVDVVSVAPAVSGPVISAWGEVQAAQTLTVRPEIAGRLEWVHPDVTAGGLLTAGTEVARFDDSDLRLAVLQAKAEIADIEARIVLEQGQATIGERELTRLSRNITDVQKSLVLREPQMAQLRAELDAARAVEEQAANALARTRVRVPFDALVIEENVTPGTILTAGMEAGVLVASDRFNVVLRVPANTLDWIAIDGTQEVLLTQPGVWAGDAVRTGRIVRLGPGLSETGRMAELIVEVEDPLALKPANAGAPKLLLGSFVEGRIQGRAVAGDAAVRLGRAYLRDDDTVWLMNADDKLEIRTVDVVWRGADDVLVSSGLAPGERVISTPLATFAVGMALRTRTGDGG